MDDICINGGLSVQAISTAFFEKGYKRARLIIIDLLSILTVLVFFFLRYIGLGLSARRPILFSVLPGLYIPNAALFQWHIQCNAGTPLHNGMLSNGVGGHCLGMVIC